MLFVLIGFDRKDGGADIRRRTRADHLRFVMQNEHVFRYGGALLGDDGKMVGSLMMVELPDRRAARSFPRPNRASSRPSSHVNLPRMSSPEGADSSCQRPRRIDLPA